MKKSLVCKRTTFDDLRNRPNYLAALNLAARTPGLRGLKAPQQEDDAAMSDGEDEERKQRAATAEADLFGKPQPQSSSTSSNELSQEEWNTVIRAMKILNRFNVDGLVSTKRGEIFHVPPKFPKDQKEDEPPQAQCQSNSNWDMDASSLLHAWLTEGQIAKTSLTLPPTTNGSLAFTSPSRAALEAALARAWPGRGLALPRGPLDIFHPQE